MIIFCIFLIRTFGQTLYSNANDNFTTIDSLGYVYNGASNLVFDLIPISNYQTILQNSTGTVVIKNAITAPQTPDPSRYCAPSIGFPKLKRRAGFRDSLSMTISIFHIASSGGNYNLKVISYFKTVSSNFQTTSPIEIVLTQTQSSQGSNSPVIIGGTQYIQLNNTSFTVNNINSSSFTGTINFDAIYNYSVNANNLNENDQLFSIVVIGSFFEGTCQTNIDYTLAYNNLIYSDPGNLGTTFSAYPFYFKLYKSLGSQQYLQIQDPYASTTEYARIAIRIGYSDNTTNKACIGERIGYYDGNLYQPADNNSYGFPLNPASSLNYTISFSSSFSQDNILPWRVFRCHVFRLRSDFDSTLLIFSYLTSSAYLTKEIHICREKFDIAVQSQGVFIETFNYTLPNLNTNITFSLYQKANTTASSPYVYSFLPNQTINTDLQLYFFVNKLASTGKFTSTERIAESSICIKPFSGSGTISLTKTIFPHLALINCLDSTKYYNGKDCVVCAVSGCITCLFIGGTTTNCTKCDVNNLWVQNGASCKCQVGYCRKGIGATAYCIETPLPGCFSCQQSNNCNKCYPNWNLTGTYCSCKPAYYQNKPGADAICISCSQVGCLECINKTVCTGCNSSEGWVINGQSCSCQQGYFLLGTGLTATCKLCSQSGCIQCTNATVCLSCNTANNWVQNSTTCSCNLGYYQLTVGTTKTCEFCTIPGCLLCISATTCSVCNTNEKWVLSNSQCSCALYYFQSGTQSTATCQSCVQQGCVSCTSPTFCLTCISTAWSVVNSSCICSQNYCKQGTGATASCVSSSVPGCLTCASSTACLSCDSSASLYLDSSTSTCKCYDQSTTYPNCAANTCSQMVGCVVCNGPSVCLSCNPGWGLSNGKCVCIEGYYLAGSGALASCLACPNGCITCSDSATCLSCNTTAKWQLVGSTCQCAYGYFFDINKAPEVTAICQICQVHGCSTCSTATTCALCDSANYYILNTTSFDCQCQPFHYRNMMGFCPFCSQGCMNCTSNTSCNLCDEQSNWVKNGSLCGCKNAYFKSGTGNTATCNYCGQGCLQCTNSSVCSSCDTNSNWLLTNSLCTCIESHFISGTGPLATCLPCIAGCLSCSNSQTCDYCDIQQNWALQNQICHCSSGFYSVSIQESETCVLCSIPGCLQCSSEHTCFHCDQANKWIQANSKCFCSPGYTFMNNGKISVCIAALETKRSLSCLLLDDNVTLENCLTAPPSTKVTMIMGATSTPNLGMILRISQLSGLVDDFTYYAYHSITYGQKFDSFVRLMWNLTSERWIPSSLSAFYYQIQDAYDEKTASVNNTLIPKVWIELDEDTNFIKNTRDFWIGSIPCALVFFVVIHIIYRILSCSKLRFSTSLLNFKWFSILALTILIQNIQVLSFRTFQQLLYGGSPLVQPFKQLYILNQITCYITFFFVIMCACAGQYLLRIHIGLNVRHALDLVKYSNSAMCFLIITQLLKIFSGFIHANFYLQNITKITLLLGIQFFILITIIYFRKTFRLKSMLALLVIQYVLRICIHLLIAMRAYCTQSLQEFPKISDDLLSQVQITTLLIIFGVAAIQLLTAFLHQQTDLKRNRHVVLLSDKCLPLQTKRKKKIIKMKKKSPQIKLPFQRQKNGFKQLFPIIQNKKPQKRLIKIAKIARPKILRNSQLDKQNLQESSSHLPRIKIT